MNAMNEPTKTIEPDTTNPPEEMHAYLEALDGRGTAIRVGIRGLPPGYIQNAPDTGAILARDEKKNATGKNRNVSMDFVSDAATRHIHVTGSGAAVIPSAAILKVLWKAGWYVKVSLRATAVPGLEKIEGETVEAPASAMIRRGVTVWPSDGIVIDGVWKERTDIVTAANVVRRPWFEKWSARFWIVVEKGTIPLTGARGYSHLREIAAIAGTQVGIGTMRPEMGGNFGRFVVEAWEPLK